MNSKKLAYTIAPSAISEDFIRNKEDQENWQIVKGFIHALVVPFIIALIAPQYTLVYVACAAFLYGTVFRYKSQGFFATLIAFIGIMAILIIPTQF